MRIAVVSDIHGNRTAFEAILADLRKTSPDLVFHGGDLTDSGSSPVEIVDHIRDLGWQGVVGNTDEMLFRPDSLTEFAKQSPRSESLFAVLGEMAEVTRGLLGSDRLAWLSRLPLMQKQSVMALVHASPESLWRAPAHTAADADLRAVYGPLSCPVAVYAHIHRSYIRTIEGMVVANTGSVSLSYDGDPRAAYLLLDGSEPAIRRVEYDLDRELKELAVCSLPHSGWVAKMLASGSPQMP